MNIYFRADALVKPLACFFRATAAPPIAGFLFLARGALR